METTIGRVPKFADTRTIVKELGLFIYSWRSLHWYPSHEQYLVPVFKTNISCAPPRPSPLPLATAYLVSSVQKYTEAHDRQSAALRRPTDQPGLGSSSRDCSLLTVSEGLTEPLCSEGAGCSSAQGVSQHSGHRNPSGKSGHIGIPSTLCSAHAI